MKIPKKVFAIFIFAIAMTFAMFVSAYDAKITEVKERYNDEFKQIFTNIQGNLIDLEKGKYSLAIDVTSTIDPLAKFNISFPQFEINDDVKTRLFSVGIPIVKGLEKGKYDVSARLVKSGGVKLFSEDQEKPKENQLCKIKYEYNFFCPEMAGAQTQYVNERQGFDIVFVIDRSETFAPIVANMKSAMLAILNKLDAKTDRVGIVSFGTYGTMLQGMNNNFSSAKNVINSWKAGDATTNIADGLKKANTLLNSVSKKQNRKIIILVSDGIANNSTIKECPESYPVVANVCTNDALTQSRLLKSQGAVIYTIGYNFNETNKIKANAGNFAKSLMVGIASASNNFSESGNLSGLSGIFDQIISKNTVLSRKIAGACNDVSIKFNYSGQYGFASYLSGAYSAYDKTGISWIWENIDRNGKGTSFAIQGQFDKTGKESIFDKSSVDGFGSFKITYKNSAGVLKELNYTHKDILENARTNNSRIDSFINNKPFLAKFSYDCNITSFGIEKPDTDKETLTEPEPDVPNTPDTPDKDVSQNDVGKIFKFTCPEMKSEELIEKTGTNFVLVVDVSASLGNKVSDVKAAVKNFISSLGKNDKYAVIFFAGSPYPITGGYLYSKDSSMILDIEKYFDTRRGLITLNSNKSKKTIRDYLTAELLNPWGNDSTPIPPQQRIGDVLNNLGPNLDSGTNIVKALEYGIMVLGWDKSVPKNEKNAIVLFTDGVQNYVLDPQYFGDTIYMPLLPEWNIEAKSSNRKKELDNLFKKKTPKIKSCIYNATIDDKIGQRKYCACNVCYDVYTIYLKDQGYIQQDILATIQDAEKQALTQPLLKRKLTENEKKAISQEVTDMYDKWARDYLLGMSSKYFEINNAIGLSDAFGEIFDLAHKISEEQICKNIGIITSISDGAKISSSVALEYQQPVGIPDTVDKNDVIFSYTAQVPWLRSGESTSPLVVTFQGNPSAIQKTIDSFKAKYTSSLTNKEVEVKLTPTN